MIVKKCHGASKSLSRKRAIHRCIEIEVLECRRLLTAIVVTTAIDSSPHTGESLRDAIVTANADALAGTSDTITFDSSLNGQTITLTQRQLELSGAGSGLITIDGANQITVSGNGASRVFDVDSGVHAMINGLTITDGVDQSSDGGGGIYNAGTLKVTNSTFSSDTAKDAGGGGIQSFSGSLTVSTSTFTGDSTNGANGGGINVFFGTATVTGCNFFSNSAEYGGAIGATYDTLSVSNCVIGGNTAGYGGAIYTGGSGEMATITNCQFLNNTAGADGGGIDNDTSSTVTVSVSTFDNNSAGAESGGGGIDSIGTLIVSNSVFTANSAGFGGGIYSDGPMTISSSTLSSNAATYGGGGGLYSDSSAATVANSTFSANTAEEPGGGILIDDTLTIVNSTISANSCNGSGYEGGGIANGGTLTLLSTIVAGNANIPDISNGADEAYGTVNPSSNHNLIGDGENLSTVSNGTNENQIGTTSSPLPPRLYPLYYNGGATQTMALQGGSSAIDAGGPITALSAGSAATDTTISVNLGSAVCSTPGNYLIKIDGEQMLVTNVSGNTLTVVRGYNGTTVTTHGSGANVFWMNDQTGQPRDGNPDIGAYEYVFAPYSTVAPLPAVESTTSFLVTWSGHPATNGPSISSYSVYYSDNGSAYIWLMNTTAPAAVFSGVDGHTYGFWSAATDALGNVQPYATAPQASTTVHVNSAPTITSSSHSTFTAGANKSFAVTASGYPASTFSETGTLPGGLTFNTTTGVLSGTPAAGTVGTYNLTFGASNGVGSPASQAFTLTVAKASSTAKLTKNTTTATRFGQSVTFTATIAPAGTNAITPSGTVTFKDGSTTLGTRTLSGGVATFTTSSLSVASHSITAVYAGDGNFTTSTSSALTQTVSKASTTTTLTKNTTAAIKFGQSVTFTAKLAAVSPGAGTPTGTVTFKDGSTTLGTRTLSSGVATFTTTSLPVGSNSITAVYGGDGNFNTSTSGALSQTVSQSATTTKLTKNTTTAIHSGQSVTFTATLAAVSPGAGTPTGIVTFYDNGSTMLGTGTLSGGIATLTTTTLPVGSNSITATYGGDTDFTGSTSNALSQTVTS